MSGQLKPKVEDPLELKAFEVSPPVQLDGRKEPAAVQARHGGTGGEAARPHIPRDDSDGRSLVVFFLLLARSQEMIPFKLQINGAAAGTEERIHSKPQDSGVLVVGATCEAEDDGAVLPKSSCCILGSSHRVSMQCYLIESVYSRSVRRSRFALAFVTAMLVYCCVFHCLV